MIKAECCKPPKKEYVLKIEKIINSTLQNQTEIDTENRG